MLRPNLGLTIAALIVAGCGAAPPSGRADPLTVEYRPGLHLDLYENAASIDGGSIVMLVHGCCGDRRDLATLARRFVDRGVSAVNVDAHGFREGGGWPSTYSDVVCAYAWTAQHAHSTGAQAAVLGWGEGALVLTAVALGWDEFARADSDCSVESPEIGPSFVLALNGHFGWTGDVPIVTPALVEWFGATPDEDPIAWAQGNPGWWLGQPDIATPRFLLLDGDGDGDEGAQAFSAELRRRKFDVDHAIVEGATELMLVQPLSDPGAVAFERVLAALEQRASD